MLVVADVLDVGLGIIVGKLVHVLVAINTYVDELYGKPIQFNLVISKSRGPVRNVRYTCTISLTSLLLPARPMPCFRLCPSDCVCHKSVFSPKGWTD